MSGFVQDVTFVQKAALTWSQFHCMTPGSSISPSSCVRYHLDSPAGCVSTCCHDTERMTAADSNKAQCYLTAYSRVFRDSEIRRQNKSACSSCTLYRSVNGPVSSTPLCLLSSNVSKSLTTPLCLLSSNVSKSLLIIRLIVIEVHGKLHSKTTCKLQILNIWWQTSRCGSGQIYLYKSCQIWLRLPANLYNRNPAQS